ncbi:unnamed protein product [Ixodes persulcatus]
MVNRQSQNPLEWPLEVSIAGGRPTAGQASALSSSSAVPLPGLQTTTARHFCDVVVRKSG